MKTTFKDRILEFLDYLEVGQTKFEEHTGLGRASISKIKDGMSSPNLAKIAKGYPELNIDWLITGSGEMLKTTSTNVTVMESPKAGVPYYESIDVSGGIVPMFNDNKEIPTFYINYPHFNDCTAYLPVVGDSMYPKYASGEIIAVKQIFNLDMIQWGEAYMIVGNSNTDDLRTIKLVHPHPDDPSKIVLRASNPNFKGDTPICINDIVNMYIVKGKITRSQL